MSELESFLTEPRLSGESGVAGRIAALVEPILRDLDMRLVRIKLLSQESSLQIMAEKTDGTMSIDDCEAASMAIAPVLDLEDPLPQAYRLEISSPGIDRPLVRLSDFERSLGQEIKIEMNGLYAGRRRFRGHVQTIDGRTLIFARSDAQVDEAAIVHLPLSGIAQARLVLTENLIRDALRAAKAQEEGDTGEGEATAQAAPHRGPGRFRAKPQLLKPKPQPKPVVPGIQTETKSRSQGKATRDNK